MTATTAITPISRAEISEHLIHQVREQARGNDRRMITLLEERSSLSPEAFTSTLGRSFHYPTLSMDALHALTAAFDIIAFPEALRRECLAFRDANNAELIVFADPFDHALQQWVEDSFPARMTRHLAHHADIAAFLARHEETLKAMDTVLSDHADDAIVIANDEDDLSLKSISGDTSPVVKLVHSTLYDGLRLGVSDIHLETTHHGLTVKYRLDGVLNTVSSVPGTDFAEQVISRIKVMSELDITERRVPQDGRFKVTVRGQEIDFRVSIMPSIFGEDAVIRILDRRNIAGQLSGFRLDHLGFDDHSISAFRHMAAAPYGMVLVTGPTGSGKTTTLYGAISEINHGQDKIVTIEDPVEYQLKGVLQIPVNEKKGLTFARGLRSILRHDPDKIMVGEIRDPETAQIAVQAALTGHLVLTTVHANNVFDVIGRFMHMGIDPYSLVSALNGIMAQRLVRMICPHCAVDDAPDDALLLHSGINPAERANFKFKLGRGCGHCLGTGYKGRKAVGEILLLNDDIRERIIGRDSIRRIKEAAREAGTRYLRENALALVARGESTLQEINRVTLVN